MKKIIQIIKGWIEQEKKDLQYDYYRRATIQMWLSILWLMLVVISSVMAMKILAERKRQLNDRKNSEKRTEEGDQRNDAGDDGECEADVGAAFGPEQSLMTFRLDHSGACKLDQTVGITGADEVQIICFI